MGKLDGKVAFITGAARGQGRSHALKLAQEGADIIAIDICEQVGSVGYPLATEEDLAETVRQVEALDRRIVASKADVRDTAQVTKAVDDGVAELGRLDIVLANAGIATFAPLEDLTDDVWDEMIAINLTGVFKTVRAAVPHLKAGGNGGAIVLTSSTAGIKGLANLAHYVAAKHGVVGLVKTFANELAPFDIRVNSVHPTSVNTDMIHNSETYNLFLPDTPNPTKEDAGAAFKTLNALPIEWVEPVDISNAIAFLVSDDARYITGVQLPVDAGSVIK
ncbi:SDR family mycofactocin-dependent oxidoreductase [Rhodococcus sp. RS1C4]|uniref:mycofactocin-coupled SDR family oxidoreductase n=1 Tax=Nocardiaceae TaxID=85025 RepID=UPI000522F626|nr:MULTISPECIES: mycofactocin-coupled SDR family oxidoreductase [Rhodococcus]OZC58407.1 SDR family mycofactocin-dependent oxidoreductase [Rhodococcus sp. RS1C4]OZC88240.1 SDR family mycofactocin-dependent oxidoreductase [Rhodococcus sp. 06-418-1B]OZD11980.1 SDR family mycofactocin-dependent oxidoreductase [Rhodococcus sp. 06-156-4C]OZD15657.1 SDR family mycofactocin-dependent oxidoreductase [Rhodococcus sp. 06-156-4a]OZD23905.1 SDR family mycofactocin-dependent oxidoreductase [Rhodococcus sp. 